MTGRSAKASVITAVVRWAKARPVTRPGFQARPATNMWLPHKL
jgi:hypothetical protein